MLMCGEPPKDPRQEQHIWRGCVGVPYTWLPNSLLLVAASRVQWWLAGAVAVLCRLRLRLCSPTRFCRCVRTPPHPSPALCADRSRSISGASSGLSTSPLSSPRVSLHAALLHKHADVLFCDRNIQLVDPNSVFISAGDERKNDE